MKTTDKSFKLKIVAVNVIGIGLRRVIAEGDDEIAGFETKVTAQEAKRLGYVVGKTLNMTFDDYRDMISSHAERNCEPPSAFDTRKPSRIVVR